MLIKLNGKNYKTNSQNISELVSETKNDNCVVIFEGFQTNENLELSENCNVSLIQKGVLPPLNELEALISARHTPKVYDRLKESSVAVAGLGGLGSNIVMALARSGVGHIHIVDFDIVEPSNLNRQNYRIKDLGKYKTEALKEQVEEVNPFVKITYENTKVTEDNAIELFKDYDIVCEAFDKAEYKAMLINTLLTETKNVTVVSGSGMAGYESSNTIKTKKINNRFYICGDGITPAEIGRGLMAPRVGICAMHQANTILRLLLGIDEV